MRKLYKARVKELKDALLRDRQTYKDLQEDISAVRRGDMDANLEKIAQELHADGVRCVAVFPIVVCSAILL